MKSTRKACWVLSAVLICAGILGGTACTSQANQPEGDRSSALPPIIVEPADLPEGTFEINMDQPLIINVDEPTKWLGETSETGVARFVPGWEEELATYNPGFEAVAPGSTSASLTDPAGTEYEFNIVVE